MKKVKKTLLVILPILLLVGIIFGVSKAGDHLEAASAAKELIIATLGEEYADEDLIKTVTRDLKALKVAGLETMMDDMAVNPDGTVTYFYTVDETLNGTFTVKKSLNGNVTVLSQEGDLHNELVITPTGRILLNGKALSTEKR